MRPPRHPNPNPNHTPTCAIMKQNPMKHRAHADSRIQHDWSELFWQLGGYGGGNDVGV